MKKILHGNLPAAMAAIGVLFCSSVALADYSDDMGSASGWVAQSFATGTQAAVSASGKVVFECRDGAFDKCTWDRTYSGTKPSLAGSNALKVKLNITNAAAISALSFYLQLPTSSSGVEWHSLDRWGTYLVEGEQEIVLPFNTMKSLNCSGTPLTCVKVDNLSELTKIRLNPSRHASDTSDFTLTIDSIEAIHLPVALLNDTDAYTQFLRTILKRYDIGYFEVKKDELVDRPIASLHPFTGAEFVMANRVDLDFASQGTFIANYLTGGSGTKFIGFDPYVLEGNLRTALGIPTLTGSPDSIKGIDALEFTEEDAEDLVLARRQPAVYSWVWPMSDNSTGGSAKAIAYWVSSSTDPATVTSKPAWLMNGVGAYRDKVLASVYHPLDNDHVLLALMMKLQPDMEAEIAGKVEAGLMQFAGFEEINFPYLMALIGIALDELPESPEKEAALLRYGEAETAYATASGGTSLEQLNAFLEARKQLTPAYALLARPEDNSEVKAVWVSNAWGPQPGNWAAPMADVAANGFTHVAVNVAGAGSVSFPSTLRCEPGYPTTSQLCFEENPEWLAAIAEKGSTPLQPALADPLTAAISAAHDNGLKFIAWKKSFALSGASLDRREWFKNNDFAQLEYYSWLNDDAYIDATTPCSDKVRQLDLALISEVATNYDVDGIQLDYIRFNSGSSSFDSKCEAGFAAYLTGKSSPLSCDWPTEVNEALSSADAACVAEYKTYKKNLITQHVSDVADLIEDINNNRPTGKPEIELSAAVYPVGNQAVSQDWPTWTGYLSRMFPMTYSASLDSFKTAVKGARSQLPLNSTFPLHFGLGGFETTADIIVGQIQWLRAQENEGDGFTHTGFSFFELNRDSRENMLPLIAGVIAFPDRDGDGVRDDSDDCPDLPNTSVCEHGLTASYFNGVDTDSDSDVDGVDDKLVGSPVLTRVDEDLDVDWGLGSPATGVVDPDYFSVRWTGQLVPPVTGTYEFCSTSDDGINLWIDDEPVLQEWYPQDGSVEHCESIALTGHKPVAIKLEFFDDLEEAFVHLTWSHPGQVENVPVPNSALYAE